MTRRMTSPRAITLLLLATGLIYAAQVHISTALAEPEPLSYASVQQDGDQVLADDPSGSGRVVEVIGNLDSAADIAVVVPGMGQNRDNFRHSYFGEGAVPYLNGQALYDELRRQEPDRDVAVVVWLGYEPPQIGDPLVATSVRARQGAKALVRFRQQVLPPETRITLVCHSYGTTVCGMAAREPGIAADVVALASPGMGVDDAGEIHARVWATRASDDWIRFVPSFQVHELGLGRGDPMKPDFGARTFSPGEISGHQNYFRPGSASLRTTARIVLGTAPLR
ncbi:alpha/beta hydrolase [Nocardiopsis gilva]|nr:alpha/beta hydrolase [Nocardiopsis gilva]